MSAPTIASCAATDCSFNRGGCAAPMVTMGTKACVTFIDLDKKGGLPTMSSTVGACKRADCVHNQDLVCDASGVKVSSDEACLTFEAR